MFLKLVAARLLTKLVALLVWDDAWFLKVVDVRMTYRQSESDTCMQDTHIQMLIACC